MPGSVASGTLCMLWVCVSSLSYPACNARAPYYIVICGLFVPQFSHIISQTAQFSESCIIEYVPLATEPGISLIILPFRNN